MESVAILERLLAFPTVSRESNLGLIGYVRELLAGAGVEAVLVPDASGRKAGLLATVGRGGGGVMLSGHTDVVPVTGQAWEVPPFALTERDGRYFGRGAADMKGFVACALAAALRAARRELRAPLHLALSYDEEVGCLGVRGMLDLLAAGRLRPRLVLVGEPTGMAVATGHKGKVAAIATFTGRAGHSALAPLALNAVHLACDFVAAVRAEQAALAEGGARDAGFEVPYSTLHVGRIAGGTALNIVPDRALVEFEIRNVPGDDPDAVLGRLRAAAGAIVALGRVVAAEAAAAIEVTNRYPGLETPAGSEAVGFVQELAEASGTLKVAYGTEAGLFAAALGVPVVVCGPGEMAQGHRPDEFVTQEQMARCDRMLDRLIDRLAAGTCGER